MLDIPQEREIALVTGAGRGIGRAIARELATHGMAVIALGRSHGSVSGVVKEIRDHGGHAQSCICDLADLSTLQQVLRQLTESIGRLDLLVNNAGAFLECAADRIGLPEWEHVLCVNLTAPVMVCKAVLPLMYRQGRGRIINIASVAGLSGYYHQAAYCAAKHGLVGYARALAIEARPYNVHVNTICPGGVRTDFFGGTSLAARLAGQTMLEPENVARAVTYLCSLPDNVDVPELVLRRAHTEHSPVHVH